MCRGVCYSRDTQYCDDVHWSNTFKDFKRAKLKQIAEMQLAPRVYRHGFLLHNIMYKVQSANPLRYQIYHRYPNTLYWLVDRFTVYYTYGYKDFRCQMSL